MRVVCTGNPKRRTIAYAAGQLWKHTTAISTSSGWNLRLPTQSEQQRFADLIQSHDVFINSSFIGPGVQIKLARLAIQHWMDLNIRGHVINIGTTLEWDSTQSRSDYVAAKIELRKFSLEQNDQSGITGVKSTYLILGGVNDGQPVHKDFVDPMSIVKMIDWIVHVPERVALMQLDSVKC